MLDQLREMRAECGAVLLEPVGRNTAPAVTLAALAALDGGGDPVLVVTPADQTVTDPAAFTAALRRAVHAAAAGAIVVLGIEPDRPETGYGYLRARPRARDGEAATVAAFVEKPDAATAARYLAEGGYYWNAGLFVLKASTWLAALDEFRPDIAAATRAAWAAALDRRQLRAPGPRRVRGDPGRVGRLRGDGALPRQRLRHPHGAAGRRLVRPRRVGRGVAGQREGRRRQRQRRRRAGARQPQHAGARDEPARRRRRRRRRGGGRDARRGAGEPARRQPERQGHRAAARRVVALRAHAAPPGAPALGLVRQHRHRPALPGQAHHGQAGRDAVAAEAPPPRRALDRRLGHRRGHLRRQGDRC